MFTNAFSATPLIPPKPTPIPPNPTPITPGPTPIPPGPATGPPPPNPGYDVADLVVTKLASAPIVTRGQEVGFRITVKNRGPNPAERVVLADQPRAASTVVAAHTTGGSCHRSGRLTVCPLGTLKHGASVTITVRTRVDTHSTRFINRAVVGSSTLEQSLTNNVAHAEVSVVGPPPRLGSCASSIHPQPGTLHTAC